jgi:hypothetical protein
MTPRLSRGNTVTNPALQPFQGQHEMQALAGATGSVPDRDGTIGVSSLCLIKLDVLDVLFIGFKEQRIAFYEIHI